MTLTPSKFFYRAVPILLGLLLLARLIGMAAAPLLDTTEARYGEISRKMAELNDWVTPWFDHGVPYWGKPPLAFWVTAISFKLFGVNEFSARLPHLIISLLIVGLVVWLAARRDRDATLPTLALISGSFLFFVSSGAVMTDIELILGTTLTMAGFWLALEDTDGPGSKRPQWSTWRAGTMFFGGLILGLLAKGPVALVLSGAPIFVWVVYNRRWLDTWRRLPWIGGMFLTLLIAMPWYWLAEQRTPGFLEYFLLGEHWHRFVTPGWEGDRYGNAHEYPVGAIWAFAFIDTLPWSILLPLAAWYWRREIMASTSTLTAKRVNAAGAKSGAGAGQPDFIRSEERTWQGYLLAWTIAPLLLFTPARNIIMTYVLPGLPAAAILAGGWMARHHRAGRQIDTWLSLGLAVTLLVACGVAIVDVSQPDKMQRKSVKTMLAVYDQARAHPVPIPAANAPDVTLTPSDAPLIFISFRPFSAEFYSRGEAIRVINDEEGWRRIGAGAAYVATRVGDLFITHAPSNVGDGSGDVGAGSGSSAPARESAPARQSVRPVARIGRYGEYDLFFVAAR
jgi:4-amino-4-deoxy-L-arabinose transferase-like glycosyltransferase